MSVAKINKESAKTNNVQKIENKFKKLSEKEEEILESIGKIYELAQENIVKRVSLAETLQCSPALVNKLLKSLEKKGLIIHKKYGEIKLTATGLQISNALIRRHRLSEALLVDILGIDASEAHHLACKFEHILDSKISDRIEEILKCPNTCPHGNPIPSKVKKDNLLKNQPLASFDPNEKLQISRILNEKSDLLRKLSQVGIEVGATIKIIKKSPLDGTLLVEINGKNLPLGVEIAKNLQGIPIKEGEY